jgi:hypothetical protein
VLKEDYFPNVTRGRLQVIKRAGFFGAATLTVTGNKVVSHSALEEELW